MTADERDLTPEEEAELSRLLADAGGPVATPPEVVARLDDVLAGLVAERGGKSIDDSTDADAPVVSLESARRRRRWPKALLAAAAVVAGGYGVGTALTGTTMSGDAISADESAAGGSDSESASDSDAGGAGDGRAMESKSKRDPNNRRAQAPANASSRQAAPRLSSDRLAEDVVRLLEDGTEDLTGDTATVPKRALVGAAAACLPGRLGPDDTWFIVRYDGSRAALVTTPAGEGTVEASVLGCDGERLDSVTVPAP